MDKAGCRVVSTKLKKTSIAVKSTAPSSFTLMVTKLTRLNVLGTIQYFFQVCCVYLVLGISYNDVDLYNFDYFVMVDMSYENELY